MAVNDVVSFIFWSGEAWWDRVHDDAATPVEPGSPLDDPDLLPGDAPSLAEHLDRAGKAEQAKRVRSAVRLDELSGLVAHGVKGGRASREPWEHVRLGDGLS